VTRSAARRPARKNVGSLAPGGAPGAGAGRANHVRAEPPATCGEPAWGRDRARSAEPRVPRAEQFSGGRRARRGDGNENTAAAVPHVNELA